jgi:hypothetical protein
MQNYKALILENYKSEGDLEEIIVLLKQQGASQIESVKVLVDALNIPLQKAGDVVDNSEVWKHMRETNEHLRSKFFEEE